MNGKLNTKLMLSKEAIFRINIKISGTFNIKSLFITDHIYKINIGEILTALFSWIIFVKSILNLRDT